MVTQRSAGRTGSGRTSRADAARLDAADPLAALRGRFVIGCDDGDDPGRSIYLDGNSLGRLSRATMVRLAAAVEEWGNRLVEGWQDWHQLAGDVGDRLGTTVLGAGPGQVVVTDSTTVNLYKLASAAVDARPGRKVIVADREDFPTDRYVLEGLAASRGLELRLLASDPVEGMDIGELGGAINNNTALVCLSHVNYRSSATSSNRRSGNPSGAGSASATSSPWPSAMTPSPTSAGSSPARLRCSGWWRWTAGSTCWPRLDQTGCGTRARR